MKRPLIGVTTSITVDRSPERAYLNTAYLRAVQLAGGVPVLLPPQLTATARDHLRDRLDGVILTGGGDIDPARFDEPPHRAVAEVSEARDALELDVVARALVDGRPLLAICRGIQVLNVALGGTLYQDLPSDPGGPIDHSQSEPRQQPTHRVKIEAGTRLAAILGTLELDVNSMHHQAIRRPGRGLTAVAVAPDGIVEAAELAGDERFVVGVQWHPEELIDHDPAARNLFAAVVEAARRR
jgi:putative glutamine amidotransferase